MVDEALRQEVTSGARCGRLCRTLSSSALPAPQQARPQHLLGLRAEEDEEEEYMSRYRFQDSIRDNTTLPLHFEAVDVKLRVDQA